MKMYEFDDIKEVDIHVAYVIIYFEHIINASALPQESCQILKQAIEFLEDTKSIERELFDQTMVGALLYALALHDKKNSYYDDGLCINPAREMIFEWIQKDFTGIPESERIFYIGFRALCEKTIVFNGEFSSNTKFQEEVSKYLPFINKNYFSHYGISCSLKNQKKGTGSLGMFGQSIEKEPFLIDILNVHHCNLL